MTAQAFSKRTSDPQQLPVSPSRSFKHFDIFDVLNSLNAAWVRQIQLLISVPLVDVLPLDDVWVTANSKDTQLARLRPGQPVEVNVDAYGHKWKGRICNLGAGTGSLFSLLPENATGNYVKVVQRVPVRIDFDRPSGQDFNVEGLLKPGLSVEPKVKVR
jgi:multidrug resistance efflux pump